MGVNLPDMVAIGKTSLSSLFRRAASYIFHVLRLEVVVARRLRDMFARDGRSKLNSEPKRVAFDSHRPGQA